MFHGDEGWRGGENAFLRLASVPGTCCGTGRAQRGQQLAAKGACLHRLMSSNPASRTSLPTQPAQTAPPTTNPGQGGSPEAGEHRGYPMGALLLGRSRAVPHPRASRSQPIWPRQGNDARSFGWAHSEKTSWRCEEGREMPARLT